MVMYCPFCRNELTEPIGRFCGSCGKDIQFFASALLDGAEPLSDEMTEAALFRECLSKSQIYEDVKDLEPGDLIEIFRGASQHWAVYIGDWQVVHLVALGISSSGASSSVSGGSVNGKVKKENIQAVINGDKWKKNNIHDKKLTPRPGQEVVREALSMVDKDMEYSIASWNCEHFVTKCRYGKALSVQAERLKAAATAGSASS